MVIGAGVGGLTAAALLSRTGLSVAVLEMDARPGGYLAGFKRKHFRFDSSIHWLNQCAENGFVYRIFSGIGSDFPKVTTRQRIRRMVGDNLDWMLTNNPDEFRDELIRAFPHEQKGLHRFFKAARNLSNAFTRYYRTFRDVETRAGPGRILHGLRKVGFGMAFLPYVFYDGEGGVEKGLRHYFRDPDLLQIWASQSDLLSCLIPLAWAYSDDYQYPPEGGGQVISEWLVHVIESYGNPIFYQTKALRILDDGERAQQVLARCQGQDVCFQARHIIAACDVESLYETMLRPEKVPAGFLRKLKEADLYRSAVTVHIGLDCPAEALGFQGEILLITGRQALRTDYTSGDPRKGDISVLAPSVSDKSMAPDGKGTLTLYASADFDDFGQWGVTRDDQGRIFRGDSYRKIKKEFADILLDRVEKSLHLDIRSHIECQYIATPITYFRYTGNRKGSVMGARPGKLNFKARIAHLRTPLKNLFLCGHWAALGGGVPIAASTAANVVLLILKQEHPAVGRTLGAYLDGRISPDELNRKPGFRPYSSTWKRSL